MTRRRRRSNPDGAVVTIAVLLSSSAVVAGLVYYGHRRKVEMMGTDDPIGPSPVAFLFPDLRVGSVVMVSGDAARGVLPGQEGRLVRCLVDVLPADRSTVGVLALDPALLGFRGTVPRSAIVRVDVSAPPGLPEIPFFS